MRRDLLDVRNAMQPLIERVRSVATVHTDADDAARAAAQLVSDFADSLVDDQPADDGS